MDTAINNQLIYLNTAACGLVSEPLASEGIRFYRSLADNGSKHAFHWLANDADRIRKHLAGFLSAPEANVAMIPSFSWGMNAVVQSLQGTEKILLYERDYPSLINPFQVNHFDISWLPTGDGFNIEPEFIERIFKTKKIDLFAFSHVQWLSGAMIDLKRVLDLCRRYGVRTLVDTTQSLGAMPVSVQTLQPDVLISSNYKWMNAGFGTGVIYLSDGFLEQYPPVYGGVNSYELKEGKVIRRPSVLDLEPGHLNMAGLNILEAAVTDKNQRGLAAIQEHNRQLTEQFVTACPGLPVTLIGEASMRNRSAIVVLKDENGLGTWLEKNNIVVTVRNETIRLSFHYYNTREEVATLINCLQHLPLHHQK